MSLNEGILKNDEKAVYALRSLYRKFGYSQYKMSKFEEYDLYVRNKDFLVSDGIITFTDTNGKLLALKPDVTLSIINNSKDINGFIQKVYYNENVYRVSRSSHTYKEIMQTGLECIGDIGLYEICEVLSLALKSLAIIDEKYALDISHVGLVSALLDECKIPVEARKEFINCINQKNADGIALLSEKYSISEDSKNKLKPLLKNYSGFNEALKELSETAETNEAKNALKEFKDICSVLTDIGYSDKINIDFSIANDMSYYSGVVFKGYIDGIPAGVLSGGQYNKLMKKMGKKSGAIGFAVYLDMLERLNRSVKKYDVDTVLISNGDVAGALKTAETLSAGGTSVMVCRTLPEKLRYRQLLKITGKGIEPQNGND